MLFNQMARTGSAENQRAADRTSAAVARRRALRSTAARRDGPREHGRRPRAASGAGPAGQGESNDHVGHLHAAAGGVLSTPGMGVLKGRPRPAPCPHATPAHPNSRTEINNQPAWNPGAHTFPSPNVKHHLGQKRQASPGTKHSM